MLVVGVVTLGGRGHIRGGRGHAGGRAQTVCGRVHRLPGGRRRHALWAWSHLVGVVMCGRGHAVPRVSVAGLLSAFRGDDQPAVWLEGELELVFHALRQHRRR